MSSESQLNTHHIPTSAIDAVPVASIYGKIDTDDRLKGQVIKVIEARVFSILTYSSHTASNSPKFHFDF